MKNTTIQVSKKLKEKIDSFGMKGETYEEILERIYNLAVEVQLREFLNSSDKFISLDDFEEEVENKWPKSK